MIYSISLFLAWLLHPFHVSVTEIKFKEEEKVLQVSSRMFLDDLEEVLQAYTGRESLDITDEKEWAFVNEQLKNYSKERFRLEDEKGSLMLNYVGAEIEDDVLWMYLEVEKVKKIGTVIVWSSMLTDVYDDQENLIHFRAFDKVKSARLYKGEEEEYFVWK